MIKLLDANSTNIAEAAYKDTNVYDIRSAVANGYIALKGLDKAKLNKAILEQFGIALSEKDETTDVVDGLIAETNYNPLLIIHHLKEAGDIEGVRNIKEAWEEFARVVNSYATEEISTKNSTLVKNVLEVVNMSISE